MKRGAAWLAAAQACALAACASWHAAKPVAPPIAGELLGEHAAHAGARIERRLRHHDNPRLGVTDSASIGEDGRFAFPPLSLDVTAQEFSKVYVLTLSLVANGERRTIYHEEYSRLEQREQLALVCNLAAADALPCRPLSSP